MKKTTETTFLCAPFYKKAETPAPFDDVILFSDGEFITGLIFDNPGAERNFGQCENARLPVFDKAERWLALYFSGKNPPVDFGVKTPRCTPFQKCVYEILRSVPYGTTISYGELARRAELKLGKKTSARAVGGAVGANPLCIVVPCHRVVGKGGDAVGYSGGINNKLALLALENA
ncbi:MAG: methylated-DNA--[protein]-cysteine S-methyltransferase [Candidatus Neoclostridium sp.]